MDKLAFAPNEKLIRETQATFERSWLSRFGGRLCLTDQRLVFVDSEFPDVPVAQMLKLRHLHFVRLVVPRDNLVSASIGTARKKQAALLVESSDGFTYKLITDTNDDWQTELRRMIESDRAAMEELLQRLAPKTLKPAPYR